MPRFSLMNPHEGDSARAELVQSYMVLHAKQTAIRRRLSTTSSASPSSSGSASPDLTPRNSMDDSQMSSSRQTMRHSMPASPRSRSLRAHSNLRRPSVPPIAETLEEHDIDSDEGKLCEINQRIKAILSDLMECDSVQRDERMRSWVQARLDAQQDLTNHRRHSSTSSVSSRSDSLSSSHGWAPAYADAMRLRNVAEHEPMRKLSI